MNQGRGGLDGVLMCTGALGVAGGIARRRSPGARALLIAVHTRSARSGSLAIARAASTSSPAVRPCRLRITRRVESRIRLSNVVSSDKRCRSIIVCTKVESSTAEVGSFVPLQAQAASTVAMSTIPKRRAVIGSYAMPVPQVGEGRSERFPLPEISGAGTRTAERQGRAATGPRSLKQDRGVPYLHPTPRRTAAMWITC